MISKYWLFVISILLSGLISSACDLSWIHERVPANKKRLKTTANFEEPVVVAKINSAEISESSGLVYSRCSKDVLWTHNDSGNGNFIFALNTKGKVLGKWKVTGATNRDWEDLATYRDDQGKCFLYIGDIGNNGMLRSSLTVFKVPEPVISSGVPKSGSTEPAKALSFSYQDGKHNAETLMVHPVTGAFYVVTKAGEGAAFVFKIDTVKNTASKVAEIKVPSIPNGFITGGEIAPDGKSVILCDYFGGYIFVLPEEAKNFDEIWKQKPSLVDLGNRKQGEAVAFSGDGSSIYATSEKSPSPLIMVKSKE